MKPKNSAAKSKSGDSKTTKSAKKPIEQYEHKDKKRANIPPVGLVTPQTDPIEPRSQRKEYKIGSGIGHSEARP